MHASFLELSRAPEPTRLRNGVAAATAVVAVVLALVSPIQSATAASEELVTNGDFSAGMSGWRTNSEHEVLSLPSGGVAQLTTTRPGHAVLNDQVNTVQGPAVGATYEVSTRVRSTTPEVAGALRVREVSGKDVRTVETSFRLSDTGWHDVKTEVTIAASNAHLDLNVVAWNLPVGGNLQIDYVSAKLATASPTPEPTPPTPTPTPEPTTPTPEPTIPPPPSVGRCDAAPPRGTLFGSMMSTSGQTAADAIKRIDTTFGPVPVVRQFDSGLPFSWDSRKADLLKGRTLVTSFKVHPTAITSGKHDAFFRNWFKSAPSDQTIYWSYFHEPENNINAGEFTPAQYRAAWARLANLAKEACKPNMFATLILTEWTMDPGSKRDYKLYDAGKEHVKVLAFDPYNGIHDLDRTYYEPAADMLGPIVQKMNADGRPWGIAETGARIAPGDNGTKRAVWLKDIGEYTKRHGVLFVTYFNAKASDGDYRLQDATSISVWRNLVQGR